MVKLAVRNYGASRKQKASSRLTVWGVAIGWSVEEATRAMPVTTVRKLSRLHQPVGMSIDAWHRELRRQFGREQAFTMTNAGAEPVFSDFHVTNPRSGGTYRVVIRGPRPGDNYCSCPDFATNSLGTCKHVEFVLRKIEERPRTRSARRVPAR